MLFFSGTLFDTLNSIITMDIIVYPLSTAVGVPQRLNAEVTESGSSTTDVFEYTPGAATNLISPVCRTVTSHYIITDKGSTLYT